MNRRQFSVFAATTVLALGLTACGGGGDGGAVVPPVPPVVKNVNVTPGLGAFGAGARVTAYKMDGSIIDSQVTDATGKAVINFGDYSGPFILRVNGGPTVKYYDEKLGRDADFPSTANLLAVVPKASVAAGESFGVTPLTHLAAAALGINPALAIGGTNTVTGASSAEIITKINTGVDLVYSLLGIPKTALDIFAAPILVSSTSTTVSAATPAGLYGLLLAELAAKSTTNALDQLNTLYAAVRVVSLELAKGTSANTSTLTTNLTVVLSVFAPATSSVASGTSSFGVAGSVPAATQTTFNQASSNAANSVSQTVSNATGIVVVVNPGGTVTTPTGSASGSGSGTGSGDGGG